MVNKFLSAKVEIRFTYTLLIKTIELTFLKIKNKPKTNLLQVTTNCIFQLVVAMWPGLKGTIKLNNATVYKTVAIFTMWYLESLYFETLS